MYLGHDEDGVRAKEKQAAVQSKKGSALEVTLNIGSGFITAMLTWQFIAAPLFGYTVTLWDNFWLTMIFTVVSVVRSYIWRRIFNFYLIKEAEHDGNFKTYFRHWCNERRRNWEARL